jgi:hypothetical protein
MEAEGLLLCFQGSATGPYPELDEFITNPTFRLFKINLNIILPYTPKSS